MTQHRRDAHGVLPPFGCDKCNKTFASAMSLASHRQAAHGGGSIPTHRRPTVTEVVPTCIECGALGVLVSGEAIYSHRPDLYHKQFYRCECGAYCGCHPNSIVPLGFPCGPDTRRARNRAHDAFDPIWRSGKLTRAEAYRWLSDELRIEPGRCHIGMMTKAQAEAVCDAVARLAWPGVSTPKNEACA